MWCRVMLFPPIPDYAAAGLALAIGAVTLVVWFVWRRRTSEPTASVLVQGLTWFVEGYELWGPCCDTCRIHLMARPLPCRTDGVAQFELCCPVCGNIPAHRGFTLLELLELDQEARRMWSGQDTEANAAASSLRLQ